MLNFALTGVAGYVAPRHLKAIHDTGNRLIAAMDPHDSVGVLDSYFPDAAFFSEFERFDRHLEKLRRRGKAEGVQYLSICSPNHLHDAHVRLALRVGATALCEKPLVLNPWNLDALAELERECTGRIRTVLQLRLHPKLLALRDRLTNFPSQRFSVQLSYIAPRGNWYGYSWKGDETKSGGVATNIGIHFFDLLLWLFGRVHRADVHLSEPGRIAGAIELDNADVQWFLSIDRKDLQGHAPGTQGTYRSISIDGEEVEFSDGFHHLHTRVYEEILAGRGFGIEDARGSIELVHQLRTAKPVAARGNAHPFLVAPTRSSQVGHHPSGRTTFAE